MWSFDLEADWAYLIGMVVWSWRRLGLLDWYCSLI